MRLVTWIGGVVWAGSWFMMCREITHWHHVRPSLAFNYDLGPDAHPGAPLLLLYGVCAAAPVVTVTAAVTGARSRRARR